MTVPEPQTPQQSPSIVRVVELDDKRVNHIQGLVEDLKTMLYNLREDAVKRGATMDRIETQTVKLDESIRGNGKEGLNSVVARIESQVDDMPRMIKEEVAHAAVNMQVNMNTAKIKAITRDEIKAAMESPGGWMEFRQKWLFPILLSVITLLLGGLIGRFVFP